MGPASGTRPSLGTTLNCTLSCSPLTALSSRVWQLSKDCCSRCCAPLWHCHRIVDMHVCLSVERVVLGVLRHGPIWHWIEHRPRDECSSKALKPDKLTKPGEKVIVIFGRGSFECRGRNAHHVLQDGTAFNKIERRYWIAPFTRL